MRPSPVVKALAPLALLLVAGPAFAHPGHDAVAAGLAAGLLHPLLGLDHLLAMIVLGVWSAQLGGSARVWVPASFLALMACGAALEFNGVRLPRVEFGIAASLLVLGVLATTSRRLPLPAAMALAGSFALFHGAAHGGELPTLANPALFATGFLLATAALQGVGIALGGGSLQRFPVFARFSGAVVVVAGLACTVA